MMPYTYHRHLFLLLCLLPYLSCEKLLNIRYKRSQNANWDPRETFGRRIQQHSAFSPGNEEELTTQTPVASTILPTWPTLPSGLERLQVKGAMRNISQSHVEMDFLNETAHVLSVNDHTSPPQDSTPGETGYAEGYFRSLFCEYIKENPKATYVDRVVCRQFRRSIRRAEQTSPFLKETLKMIRILHIPYDVKWIDHEPVLVALWSRRNVRQVLKYIDEDVHVLSDEYEFRGESTLENTSLKEEHDNAKKIRFYDAITDIMIQAWGIEIRTFAGEKVFELAGERL